MLNQHLKNFNLISPSNLIGNVAYNNIPDSIINTDPDIYINIVSEELLPLYDPDQTGNNYTIN
ncbi:hypothetical protein [Pedobacter steynii]